MKMGFFIKGLKCDNPNCEYVDPDIPFEEYEKYVNCPCPICGESLLTPQAYRTCKGLKLLGDAIVKITGYSNKEANYEDAIHLDMDAEGKVSFKK